MPGFDGKTVAIAGTLSQDRSQIAAVLQAEGAKVVSAVGPGTEILIAGSGADAEIAKAKSVGAQVIDEDAMRSMIGP
jgi:DNA ligase (NAD+)